SVLRALHFVRPLPTRLRLHSAADPVGRHRRDGKADGDLHRLLLPAGADGGGHRGRHAARPGEGAYTLGARSSGIVRRVLLPASAPDIAETLRLVLGWAWTYVIVAELIGASSGIGHMITDSQALLDTGQIIFGIVVIGIIGLVSDYLFKTLNQRLFPWSLA